MNKYRFCAVLLLVTVAFLIGCSPLGQGAGGEEYFVKNVIDGDTIELTNGRFVRYIGIDTPEMTERKGDKWVVQPEEFAYDAKGYNKDLVYRKRVKLEFDEVKEDKYGRMLAYVYVGDTMVNTAIIEKGFSLVYTIPPNVKYFGQFLKAQEGASRDRYGLWQTLEVISPDAADANRGKYRIVHGKVLNAFLSPRRISLNFGYDKKQYLTGVIYAGNIPFFTRNNIDPTKDYVNKDVEVIGKIEYKNGPFIVIDNPSQIREK